jgi:hypothetical protein
MPDTNTITCPHCKADFPLGEAVSTNLREKLSAEFERERQRLNAAMAEREKTLAAEAEALKTRAQAVADEVAKGLEAERAKLREAAAREASEASALALKDLQEQLARQAKRASEAEAAELEMRKKQRELEEAKAAMDIEMARKLDAERQRIAEEARIRAAEAEALKLADKENKIRDLTGQIAALQKRAEQGSMQAQGETLELAIEAALRAAFPHDEITEVKKGQRGADSLQNVRTNAGQECGSILWEAKRAANWSNDWPDKLKEDQREAKADLAVLVTTCPPPGIRGIGQSEGVWICEPPFAPALAAALRQGLVATTVERSRQSNSTDKMNLLYRHLCSIGFRQDFEAVVESYRALKEQLDTEKRAFAKQWKEREAQLEKAITHTAALYGGIQGIAGRETLPEIQTLALPQ